MELEVEFVKSVAKLSIFKCSKCEKQLFRGDNILAEVVNHKMIHMYCMECGNDRASKFF
jgi:RNase P subunit RPR2